MLGEVLAQVLCAVNEEAAAWGCREPASVARYLSCHLSSDMADDTRAIAGL